ncbi:peptidyl-prolyl cis-trans isomerase [Paracoccus marinaquae]|uniref:Peptidyl-prolyl cis-trans isomerase n=1 Tax=Paracoccus marinaquae TaxID=2841926 RepID=A0ABS6AHV6_9RHOB|nr:peptidylprolyl isomerase [Paracoccus marinaquae]MBU3030179.1 peptidyl-prolyl cis-trans isomerase [Paracoccus marinaquae]
MKFRTFLRSPLLHFFVLGGLIFGAYRVISDDPAPVAANRITLSTAEARRLADQFEGTWNRAPSPQEMTDLMQAWALEEAQVREAIALGLDRGDPVIRQRLSLKMQFLSESGAALLAADEATLQAYLEANPDKFARPAQAAFEQVLLPAQAEAARTGIAALEDGADPADFAGPSLLPSRIPLTAAPTIDQMFGPGFHDALAGLSLSGWQGPIQGSYGRHLVRISERREGILPPLADIRARVEAEWRADRAAEARAKLNQALLDRFQVSLPGAGEVLAR